MMKQKLFGALIALLIFTSCEDQLESPVEAPAVASTTLATNCDISGPQIIGSTNSGTYSMTTDISNPGFQWTVWEGYALIMDPNSQTTAVSFPSKWDKVVLKGEASNGSISCSELYTITRGSSGTICSCPDPRINFYDPYPSDPDRNCNLSSNGLYTVTLSGVQSGDQISWSGNSNVNVQNGQGTTTMAFYIYNTSADFTVNCTVTRTCPDGTVFTRTATYTSNISQRCKYFGQYNSGACAGELEP